LAGELVQSFVRSSVRSFVRSFVYFIDSFNHVSSPRVWYVQS